MQLSQLCLEDAKGKTAVSQRNDKKESRDREDLVMSAITARVFHFTAGTWLDLKDQFCQSESLRQPEPTICRAMLEYSHYDSNRYPAIIPLVLSVIEGLYV